MEEVNNNDQKHVKYVVFFAHFKSHNSESHRMQRFEEEKTANDFFDWVDKTKKGLEKKDNKNYTVTNCNIIR